MTTETELELEPEEQEELEASEPSSPKEKVDYSYYVAVVADWLGEGPQEKQPVKDHLVELGLDIRQAGLVLGHG